MGLLDRDPFARVDPVVVVPDSSVAILAALDQLRAAITDMPRPARPQVSVAAPDLTDIVTAVNGLKPGVDADEIAAALAEVLRPQEPVSDEAAASLSAVAKALEKLDHRLQGVGTQAYGGGAVSFTSQSLAQLAAAVNPATVEPTVVVATVTASGDTTIHTPAAGMRVQLKWVSAINDPDEATNPLIKILLGSDEKYRAYAVAHREAFTGAVDAPLVVNLSGVASVAVTAHLVEV